MKANDWVEGEGLIMVGCVGFEPTESADFLLLHVTMANSKWNCCSLDYVFAISFDLDAYCIVSTHLQ